jgi:O-6-methylguanine DNA methyltransferase
LANRRLSPFAKKVYKVLLNIPLGEVRTYKWVAKKIRHPKAYRAVGQVLKNNPYPLIIPCHRVIASGDKIGGYAWGKKNKKTLLDLERQIRKTML